MVSTSEVSVSQMALCSFLVLGLCFAHVFNMIINVKAPGTVPAYSRCSVVGHDLPLPFASAQQQ